MAACPTVGVGTGDDSQTETALQTTDDPSGTTQACPIGSEGCACTGGGGCDLGLTCNLQTMVCEAGGGTSASDTTADPPDTSIGNTDPGQTNTSTGDTAGPECTAKNDGKESAECVAIDANRPFCVDDACVPCGELAIDACKLGTGESRPLCLESGACGQCDVAAAVDAGQCSEELPHCNLDNNMCEGCLEHSECPATACKVAARKCFPTDNVLYVRQGSLKLKCSDKPGMGGSKDMPYCDFALATAAAQLGGFNSDYTFVQMGNDEALGYPGAVNITGGDGAVSYAFVHELGTPFDKHTQLIGIGPMVTVPNNVTLYINNFGIVVENGQADSSIGVSCSDGAVWLDDSRVHHARGPGIRSNNCDIHLRRTSVAFGSTEGIDMTGGSLHTVNSFIAANLSKPNLGGGGLHLRAGATVDMLYTTIADNSNEAGKNLGDSIHCDDKVSIKLRNSILARRPTGANPSIVCPGSTLNVTWSVIDTNLDLVDGNNNSKFAAEDLLMALVLDNNSGVFRVKDSAAGEEYFWMAAQWNTGDPHYDYDMNKRNAVPGGLDYAGGDVYSN